MSKQKLFIDVDGVIIDSPEICIRAYNDKFSTHPEFKKIDVNYKLEDLTWDMKNILPLITNLNQEIFSDYVFFKHAEPIEEYTYEVLQKLNEKYHVIWCSIGTPKNISYKTIWLNLKFPFISDGVMLVQNKHACHMNKSIVNMEDAIFIDDVTTNLDSSNAKYKYVFGDIFPWNKDSKYKRLWNWTEIEKELL